MTADLIDRGVFLIIGLGIGFILGRMTRSQIRIEKGITHVEKIVEEKRYRDEGGFMQINRVITDLLYLLLLAITIFGVVRAETAIVRAERNAQEDVVQRCQAGTDVRNVQRAIVDAVWTLGAGETIRDKDAPPQTPAEKANTAAFLARLGRFREGLYDHIKPSEQCAPYVDDDNVEPEPIDISSVVRQQGEQNG